MCGRYTISTEKQYLEQRFKGRFIEPFSPIFNASPSQKLPVITNDQPDKIQLFNWGIHPIWLKNITKKKDGLINIRSESLTEKKIFHKELNSNRCLVLANSFFEWQTTNKEKQPIRILLQNEQPFAFAGLWQINQDKYNRPQYSFAILTTTPTISLQKIHTRMPVILEPNEESKWLDNQLPTIKYLNLLNPYPNQQITHYPISNLVNNPRNNSPDILLPLSPN